MSFVCFADGKEMNIYETEISQDISQWLEISDLSAIEKYLSKYWIILVLSVTSELIPEVCISVYLLVHVCVPSYVQFNLVYPMI